MHSQLWICPNTGVYFPNAAASDLTSTTPTSSVSHMFRRRPCCLSKKLPTRQLPSSWSPSLLDPSTLSRAQPSTCPRTSPSFPCLHSCPLSLASLAQPKGHSSLGLKDAPWTCPSFQPAQNLSPLHFRPLERRDFIIISFDKWGHGDHVHRRFSIEQG